MGINRRDFLKFVGITGSGALLGTSRNAHALDTVFNPDMPEFNGVLVDTTVCIGCRNCEKACNTANNLPLPEISFKNKDVLNTKRKTVPEAYTVINKFETEKGDVFVKKQCFHCNQPACVAACLVKAMEKQKTGPVTWQGNCMGCRYCMASCPFDMPKFEYDSANPKIQKCNLCWERTEAGKKPACVEACPVEALTYGTRRELIEKANKLMFQNPEKYHHQIYGEHEVGGTSWLYIAPVPFEQLGFKTNLGTTPYPEYTVSFLYSVPIILLLWPAFLIGLNTITKRKKELQNNEGGGK